MISFVVCGTCAGVSLDWQDFENFGATLSVFESEANKGFFMNSLNLVDGRLQAISNIGYDCAWVTIAESC